jgi:hypothetical protein
MNENGFVPEMLICPAIFRTILFVIKCISVPQDKNYLHGIVIYDLCVATIIFVQVNNCKLNCAGCLIETKDDVKRL